MDTDRQERPLTSDRLPSWRPGPTRDAVLAHLDALPSLPVEERVAVFDNDGTLWCERPDYVQLAFFLDALRRRTADDPSLAERPELAAVLGGDPHEIAEIGLPRIAMALAGLFDGLTPTAFAGEVRDFMAAARHDGLDRPTSATTYQPMQDLITELRALDVTVAIVTGGGTEFVRAISLALYGVPPELVVGTLIAHEASRDGEGRVVVHRTTSLVGDANEGMAKVTAIQTHLGRQPCLAAGNSAGDREMLEWATAGDGPRLALLVDHDDADREYAYRSVGATVDEDEAITDVAGPLGWTTVSMARDWATVFPST
jgi:phosphoserine phosphatase